MPASLRLSEILTTSSAVANYLGESAVSARHLRSAIAILLGEESIEDLGRPTSPFVSRATGAASTVDPAVRELAQRWFARFEHDLTREFSEAEWEAFSAELAALVEG